MIVRIAMIRYWLETMSDDYEVEKILAEVEKILAENA